MSLPQILTAVFGLSLLVIVHEAGHYFAARAFGMRVTRFSIGLGPVLVSYKPKDSPTTFQLCAIPFLAYVMIAGMNPTDEIEPNDPTAYPNQGVFARIVTVFGGPFANYVAAALLVFGISVGYGWPDSEPREPMTVEKIEPGSPAAKAGVRVNDVIVRADGKPIRNVKDLIEVTSPRAEQATVYVIKREGALIAPVTITPRREGERGIIGVTAQASYKTVSVDKAAVLALAYPLDLTLRSVEGIASLIKERSTEGITGPVGMGKIVAEEAEKGFFWFVHVLIAISVALGFFNLLPFPALDGGRLMFLGYELVTRRRPNERVENAVHALGLIFLLGVIVLVTLRDVVG